MAQSQQSFKKELYNLADFLEQKEEDILQDWKKIMSDEGNPQITKLISMSRDKFFDHFPTFLDLLCEKLRTNQVSAEKVAKRHGVERWEYGLDLRETTKEWAKLHQVLMIYINISRDSISLGKTATEEANKVVANLIHDGIINSINEYYKLQTRKAKTKMRDLNAALSDHKNKTSNNSENLELTSHDLKGALFSIRTGFKLLEDKELDEKTAEIINDMSLATENLGVLLNNLVDLFRLEAAEEELQITSFDVGQSLHNLCDSLQPLTESNGLSLRCKGPDSFTINGDRTKIMRIAQNLLVNSLKYTEEGFVEVNWERHSKDDWSLSIWDTGPGLPEIHVQSLLTVSELPNGSADDDGEPHDGLGLLIVRKLCQLVDAVIDIDAKPDDGTTFNIIFPLNSEEFKSTLS